MKKIVPYQIYNDEKEQQSMQLEQVFAQLTLIRQEIRQLRADVTRYKGFTGGMIWSVGIMSAALGMIATWLKESF